MMYEILDEIEDETINIEEYMEDVIKKLKKIENMSDIIEDVQYILSKIESVEDLVHEAKKIMKDVSTTLYYDEII